MLLQYIVQAAAGSFRSLGVCHHCYDCLAAGEGVAFFQGGGIVEEDPHGHRVLHGEGISGILTVGVIGVVKVVFHGIHHPLVHIVETGAVRRSLFFRQEISQIVEDTIDRIELHGGWIGDKDICFVGSYIDH